MSTKALRRIIDECSDIADHPNASVDVRRLLVEAIEGVMQIEAIAKDWTSANDEDRTEAQWQAHDALMRAIAKEAP